MSNETSWGVQRNSGQRIEGDFLKPPTKKAQHVDEEDLPRRSRKEQPGYWKRPSKAFNKRAVSMLVWDLPRRLTKERLAHWGRPPTALNQKTVSVLEETSQGTGQKNNQHVEGDLPRRSVKERSTYWREQSTASNERAASMMKKEIPHPHPPPPKALNERMVGTHKKGGEWSVCRPFRRFNEERP